MIWGVANGVTDVAELPARALSFRARDNDVDPDPTIGCVILRNLFFAERGHELPDLRVGQGTT
jgi:hypothetical protein